MKQYDHQLIEALKAQLRSYGYIPIMNGWEDAKEALERAAKRKGVAAPECTPDECLELLAFCSDALDGDYRLGDLVDCIEENWDTITKGDL